MSIAGDDPEGLVKPLRKSHYRFFILFWCAVGFGTMFYLRINLNVAIVAMVNRTAIGELSLANQVNITNLETNATDLIEREVDASLNEINDKLPEIKEVPNRNASIERQLTNETGKGHSSAKYEQGQFAWTESAQGIILGAYFFGHTPFQAFAGRLVEQYNAVRMAGYGMLLASLLTTLIPAAAYAGILPISLLRATIGLAHLPFSASMMVMISRWLPRTERSVATSLITVGVTFGAGLGIPVTTYLCQYGPFGGWPSAFYVGGIFTTLWSFGWLYFVTEYPDKSKRVTQYELDYIRSNKEADNRHHKNVSAPWQKIFTSMGVWASIVAKATAIFSVQIVHSKLPVYLETVLNLDLQTNGLVNSIVNFSAVFSTVGAGFLADYLHRRKLASLTNIRKIFQTVTMLGPAICFAIIPSFGSDIVPIVSLLILSMIFFGFLSGGDIPITTDMAPHFSGTLFGITNTVGSATGFLAPTIAGLILDMDHGNAKQWNIIWYMTTAVLVIGCLFFDVFATAEVQPWGLVSQDEDGADEKLKKLTNGSCKDNEKEQQHLTKESLSTPE